MGTKHPQGKEERDRRAFTQPLSAGLAGVRGETQCGQTAPQRTPLPKTKVTVSSRVPQLHAPSTASVTRPGLAHEETEMQTVGRFTRHLTDQESEL